MPTFYLIGGPNGAGKTTFARGLLQGPRAHLRFLNADEVARGYSPFDPDRMAIAAGRYVLTEAKRLILAKESFVMESTLSGLAHVKLLQEAKRLGFQIKMHILWIPSADFSKERVSNRVSKGGHDVPEEALERRFSRIRENLIHRYLPLADRWLLWNSNSSPAQKLLESPPSTLADARTILLP